MKVTLDLDRLLQDGRITADEYTRLERLGARQTASLGLNIVIGFGVIAVAGSVLALLESAAAAIPAGISMTAFGMYLGRQEEGEEGGWEPLATILLLIGSLLCAGGIVWVTDRSPWAFAILFFLLAPAGVIANSGLLVSMSALSLLAASGGMTAYGNATYYLGTRQPLVTVVLFSILALAAYRKSLHGSAESRRLATIFSRTCVLIVNLGFWIGSLWGDPLGAELVDYEPATATIPDLFFVITWAAALISVGVWAAGRNRRWTVNVVAVFGAIHFYTQYFERLSLSPASVLFAGIMALAIALGVVGYNSTSRPGSPGSPRSNSSSASRRTPAPPRSRPMTPG